MLPSPEKSAANPGGASRWLDALYLTGAIALLPWFAWRRWVRKKQSPPWRAKLAHFSKRSAGQPRIWIHAVSVGETNAAETLVNALRAQKPDVDIVVSTTTVTGQAVAARRYGSESVIYYPLDLSWVVRRALDRLRPTVIVLMELEVWPNLTAEAARRGIPVVVVNARITERSARRYRRFWWLVGGSFRRVELWLAQTEEYARRLRELGVDGTRVRVAGNLKYDAVDTSWRDEPARLKMRTELGLPPDAPVLIGGSTHPTEENALLQAVGQLRRGAIPNLRLILVPRHPERLANVAEEIAQAGPAAIRRSEIARDGAAACIARLPAGKRQDWVLLVDTMGELKALYAAADVAFVGGSLIPHGGQNVMEPSAMGVPVVHGPHMHNFNEAVALLQAAEGSIEVTRESLAPAVERLLRNPGEAQAMADRARAAFVKEQGATQRVLEGLSVWLALPRPQAQQPRTPE